MDAPPQDLSGLPPELASTSAVTVLSSAHGRQRRMERKIAKRDLQAAIKYGTREPGHSCPRTGEKRWLYRFADVVYVTDETSRKEITSWPEPGAGIDVLPLALTIRMMSDHKLASDMIREDPAFWTSHTVIVVDQSGSMRKDDVADGITRSDAVWLVLALELVGKQLTNGEASSSDVISVVGMNETSNILFDRRPTDWVLYNDLLQFLRSAKPQSSGNYAPAFGIAENLLMSNTCGKCSLALVFLSDGAPSDQVPMGLGSTRQKQQRLSTQWISNLASRFGRRLHVATIGFGGAGEDFSVLNTIATCASSFGSNGAFQAPSLTAESLGVAVASITSSLTSSRTELTEVDNSRRTVRDVRREARESADDVLLTSDWDFYPATSVRRVVWSFDEGPRGDWVPAPKITEQANGVAVRKKIFGEGAERMVRKFREVGPRGQFVGPKLVAKESRFVEDLSSADARLFHRVFCKTQIKAKHLADAFNARLAEIPFVDRHTPRVAFLDCSVFVLEGVGYLVEEMLDPVQYGKWNSNNGYVRGNGSEQNHLGGPLDDGICADPLDKLAPLPIDAIAESDEEEEEEEEEEEPGDHTDGERYQFKTEDIPQAFTHFTQRKTRNKMVCDLQGVLDTSCSPPLFRFTDPVIHYASREASGGRFGRTDKGRKGWNAFFETHKCSGLCRALSRRWAHPKKPE